MFKKCCPNCFGSDLVPYQIVVCPTLIWQPYAGYLQCAECGKIVAPTEVVELRELAPTTEWHERAVMEPR